MADGKITKHDIPQLVLLITELITTTENSTTHKMPITSEEMIATIDGLYTYIMGHYKLFPSDELEKTEFKQMFDLCVKLVLFQPNINKKLKSIFSCFH
jgi:hypothetical protein